MRIHILSDLHIEFGPFELPKVDADVLVIAGDVHTKLNGIKWIKEYAPKDIPIIYIMGNHEFYGEKHPRLIKKIKAEAEAEGTNVNVLENESIEIDGYHFFGSTLWTDMNFFGNPMLGGLEAQQMNDYKRIRVSRSYKRLTPRDTSTLHTHALDAMSKFFEMVDSRRTTIITHHAPSELSLPKKRREELISAAYASHLDEFIRKHEPHLWIHGHIQSVTFPEFDDHGRVPF